MTVPAVGVTIITGFLGAGKSTLIRRVLTENHGLRIVVVENEFADTGAVETAIVTAGLAPGATIPEIIELPNGCICCAAQDDLTDALSRLVRERTGRFDYVLVEASGLADPGPVAAAFWVDEELESQLRLDGVVAVVDAANVEAYFADVTGKNALAEKQIAVADVILLNKTDLLGGVEDVERVHSAVRHANSSAKMLSSSRCDVDLVDILNIHAYDRETAARVEEPATHAPVDVLSVTVTYEGVSFDALLLDRALGRVLWEDRGASVDTHSKEDEVAREVWRMKALVVVAGDEFKHVYQAVHTLFEGEPSGYAVADDPVRLTQFVFIGRGLTERYLRESLSHCCVDAGES